MVVAEQFARVGERAGRNTQRSACPHDLAAVVDAVGDQAQIAFGMQRPGMIDGLSGGNFKLAGGDHLASVSQVLAGFDPGAVGGDLAAVIEAAAGDFQVATGIEFTRVIQALGLDAQLFARDTPLFQDAADDLALVAHRTAFEADIPSAGQGLPYHQIALGLQVDISHRKGRALQVDRLGLGREGADAGGVGQAQAAIGIDHDVAGGAGHIARQPYADALLSAHQANRPGVHAAEGAGIDGQLRLVAAILGMGTGLQSVSADIVSAGDNVELVGMQLRVELGRARDQVELADIAGIEPGALHRNVAAVYAKVIQPPLFDHGLAGGQRRARRIDKPAAIAGDAVRIGDDHPRGMPGHFGVAPKWLRLPPVTSLRITLAGRPCRPGLPRITPPSWVVCVAWVALLRISPLLPTL